MVIYFQVICIVLLCIMLYFPELAIDWSRADYSINSL